VVGPVPSFRTAYCRVIPNPLLPCHSEPLTPVSFRTPYSRVIPNPLLLCHSERSEESAVGNTAEGDAKLEEIPRRYAPRNDILKLKTGNFGRPSAFRHGPRVKPGVTGEERDMDPGVTSC
jgi:hypothetical protein